MIRFCPVLSSNVPHKIPGLNSVLPSPVSRVTRPIKIYLASLASSQSRGWSVGWLFCFWGSCEWTRVHQAKTLNDTDTPSSGVPAVVVFVYTPTHTHTNNNNGNNSPLTRLMSESGIGRGRHLSVEARCNIYGPRIATALGHRSRRTDWTSRETVNSGSSITASVGAILRKFGMDS